VGVEECLQIYEFAAFVLHGFGVVGSELGGVEREFCWFWGSSSSSSSSRCSKLSVGFIQPLSLPRVWHSATKHVTSYFNAINWREIQVTFEGARSDMLHCLCIY